jgi:hypothetical protein
MLIPIKQPSSPPKGLEQTMNERLNLGGGKGALSVCLWVGADVD